MATDDRREPVEAVGPVEPVEAVGPVEPIDPVEPRYACPHCGERECALLVWSDDGKRLRCETCNTVYEPGGVADARDQATR